VTVEAEKTRAALEQIDCANSHQHTVDGPACHTAEIIAKAGM
jgi:hypothetical protein